MSADDIYIVGAARTEFGRYDGEDNELAEQAVRGALADCGLAWTDMQFAVGGTNGETKPDNLVSRLGLTGIPVCAETIAIGINKAVTEAGDNVPL